MKLTAKLGQLTGRLAQRAGMARVLSVIGLLATMALPTAALAQTASATVSITDAGFQPSPVTIAVGGSVTWTNNGSGVHSVTSTGWSFRLAALNPGQTFVFTFSQLGTYGYSSYFDCHDDNGRWRQSNGNFNCLAALTWSRQAPWRVPARHPPLPSHPRGGSPLPRPDPASSSLASRRCTISTRLT